MDWQPVSDAKRLRQLEGKQRWTRSRKSVANVEGRPPRTLAFEHGDLLAENKDLESGIGSSLNEGAEGNQGGEEAPKHKLKVSLPLVRRPAICKQIRWIRQEAKRAFAAIMTMKKIDVAR